MPRIGTPLSPTATRVLLCGSGELGKEVVIELQRLGCEVIAVDRYANAPAMQVAHRSHVLSMLDGAALRAVIEAEQPHYIVPEIEAIATDTLVELEAEGFTVVPTSRAAKLTMNREGIRRLAAEELGLPTSPYHFADTFEKLVTGQMRETVGAEGAGANDPVEHYLKVIDEKTGVLIASAAYLGARHSGATDEVVERCARIGDAVGMVFQIVDDIIDIFSDPEQSGKTPGTDLREGVFTLPVLYALEEDSEAGEALRGLLTGPLTDDTDVARALELLSQTRGRERALETARGYLATVERELDALPDIPAREALRTMTRLTVDRVG